MDTTWEERHPALLARLAGAGGIAFVVATLLPGNLGGPLFDNALTTSGLLSWVKTNTGSLPAQGFVGAVESTVAILVLVALLTLARARGLAARVVTVALGGFLAIQWIDAALSFALADAARRTSADAGIVALFSLAKSMVFADGFAFGIAAILVSLLALRARTLPSPVCWLGVITGAVHLVALPVQFAINSRPDGVTGPISVLFVLVWFLATSLVLVIRPVRDLQPTGPAELAPA